MKPIASFYKDAMALEVLSLNSNCRGIMHALCVPYMCGFLNVWLKILENLVYA